MNLSDLDYRLPQEQIAQRPLARRDASRLLMVERSSGVFQDRNFCELPALLRGDELVVLNNARVIPARLLGHRVVATPQTSSLTPEKEHPGGKVEIFLTRRIDGQTWEALVRPGRKMRIGERVLFGAGELEAEVTSRDEHGQRTVRFSSRGGGSVEEHLERLGHVPLPPYIDRLDDSTDRQRYQTVFASQPGAIAAPTAGLHFTEEILIEIRQRGVEICEITLNVGLGTFQPIHSETLEGHVIHKESYEISEDSAKRMCAAKASGRPIVAIGTTVVRALEDSSARARQAGIPELLLAGKAEAGLFITPGFSFRVVDALLTNFHLPQSTLLALVCAFAGRDTAMAAYDHAVKAKYRFYSYGDCMFIR